MIHERFHVKDPAPAGLHQIQGIQRVADRTGVESGAFVGDPDLQLVIVELKRRVHFLPHIELVAVFDGVCDRLANRHSDPVGPVLVQSRILTEMFGDHLDKLDVFKSAADGDLDSLSVPVPLHETGRHSK